MIQDHLSHVRKKHESAFGAVHDTLIITVVQACEHGVGLQLQRHWSGIKEQSPTGAMQRRRIYAH